MDGYSSLYYPNRDFPYLLDTLWSRARNGTLDRLESVDCIDQYATLIQPYRRNVLLVAADDHFPGPDKNTFINSSHVMMLLHLRQLMQEDRNRPQTRISGCAQVWYRMMNSAQIEFRM